MKVKGSGKDSRGYLYVDCAECKRGGNGNKSCSAGARHKRIHKGMCFSGELIEGYEV